MRCAKRDHRMRAVTLTSFILVLIGAINWLLVGTSRFDLVRWLVRRRVGSGASIYDLVGTAGLTQLVTFILRRTRGKLYPDPVKA